MTENIFDKEIALSFQRLEQLWQRSQGVAKPPSSLWQPLDEISIAEEELLLRESLSELTYVLEELQVASEELEQQSQELIASRGVEKSEEQSYQELFELTPDAYIITNPEGVIQQANPAAVNLLNIRGDRLIGKPLVVFIAESNRTEFRTQVGQLKNGQPLRNWELELQPRNSAKEQESEKYAVVSTGKSRLNLQNQFVQTICNVTPIPNLEGQVAKLCWVLQQVTSPQQTQQFEPRFNSSEAILEASSAIIFACDRNGNFIYASTAATRMLELSPNQIIGKSLSELFPLQVMETVQKVQGTPTPITHEFMLALGDRVKDFEYTVSPYKEGVVIAIADITKHKQVQSQLNQTIAEQKQLDEIKARFISIISHELRNPLNRVFIATQLLKNYAKKWTEEQKNAQLNYILSAAQQTNQVLNDMLLVLKAECGKLKLQPGLLNLEKFCRKILEEMQVNIDKKNTISFSCQGNPNFCLDEKLLRPILTNLLSNAVKYSPELSQVEFNLTCERGEAIFCIKDQGIGIPQSDQEKLFVSFQRASNVGNIEGTGIGLFIVKQCVYLLGGKIEIKSEVGRGTQVTVSLPVSINPQGFES